MKSKKRISTTPDTLEFADSSIMGGVFAVSLAATKRILPKHLSPLVVAPHTALAVVFGMEHKKSDLGAYNEVAVALPLSKTKIPFSGLFETLFAVMTGSFDMYPCQLPVSVEKAREPGVRIFGMPKYLAEIAFRETHQHRICTVRDKISHELILELDIEKIALNSPFTRFRNRQVVRIPSSPKNPTAQLNCHLKEWGVSFLLPQLALRWGRDAHATELKTLKWGMPLLTLYAPEVSAVLSEMPINHMERKGLGARRRRSPTCPKSSREREANGGKYE